MKDFGDAFFMLGIEIHRDKSQGLLGLYQKSYVEKVLKKFNMPAYSHSPTPIQRVKSLIKPSVLKMMKRNLE